MTDDISSARKSGYITTYTDQKLYIMDPEPSAINIHDIAQSLSNICRWGGHVKRFYSVAQHCVRVSELCDPDEALVGLLHDASEAYLGDMTRPLKYLPEMAIYKVIEESVTKCIAEAFGLPSLEKPPSVEEADNIALAVESINLRLSVPDWAWDTIHRFNVSSDYYNKFIVWPPDVAKAKFLGRYYVLINNQTHA